MCRVCVAKDQCERPASDRVCPAVPGDRGDGRRAGLSRASWRARARLRSVRSESGRERSRGRGRGEGERRGGGVSPPVSVGFRGRETLREKAFSIGRVPGASGERKAGSCWRAPSWYMASSSSPPPPLVMTPHAFLSAAAQPDCLDHSPRVYRTYN